MKPVEGGLRRREGLTALLAASVAPWPLAARAAKSVPMLRPRTGDIGGLVGVEAEMSGLRGIWLIDSGSTGHVIDASLAQRLRLPVESNVALAAAGGSLRVPRVRLPSLRLGADALDLGVALALAVDLQAVRDVAGSAVAGILGVPLLAGRTTRFDFAAERIEFDAAAFAPGEGAIDVALGRDTELPSAPIRLGDRVSGEVLIDTGNAGALVLFSHTGERLMRDHPLPTLVSREIGGSVAVAYARSATFALGDYQRRELPVALERGGSARRGRHFDRLLGSLGNAVFEGTSLNLDLQRRRLQVLRRDRTGEAMPGSFGFAATVYGHHLVLDQVLAGGPAARAGLLPGDTVVGVDGQPLPAEPVALWGRLHGHDSAVFEFERDSRHWQVRLTRARFLPLLD